MKQISEENKSIIINILELKSKLNFITASIEKNMMKKKTRQMKNSKIILRKYRNTNYEKNIEENREERRN